MHATTPPENTPPQPESVTDSHAQGKAPYQAFADNPQRRPTKTKQSPDNKKGSRRLHPRKRHTLPAAGAITIIPSRCPLNVSA